MKPILKILLLALWLVVPIMAAGDKDEHQNQWCDEHGKWHDFDKDWGGEHKKHHHHHGDKPPTMSEISVGKMIATGGLIVFLIGGVVVLWRAKL